MTAPKFPGNVPHMAVTSPEAFAVLAFADGTTTRVDIYADGRPIAQGHAKRRRQDKRVPELGTCLALMRAFENAAAFYEWHAEKFLYPRPTPLVIKRNAKEAKAIRRAEKDKRRSAAREAYAEAKAVDWEEMYMQDRDDRGL